MSFRNEFKKIKNESLKVKLEYIFTYYWLPIVIAAVLLVTLVSQVIHFATQKEIVLSGHCINAVFEQAQSEQLLNDVFQKMNINQGTGEIAFSNSLLSSEDLYSIVTTHQLIAAKIASKYLDFLAVNTVRMSQKDSS